MKKTILTTLSLVTALGLAFAAPREDDPAAISKVQRPSYPLRQCVVSGKKFGKEAKPIEHIAMGRLLLVCSEDCKAKITESPETFVAKLNEAVIREQKPIYPVTTCVVSGEELGSMGTPIEFVQGTRLVRLCCKGCKKKMMDDPATFIAKVDEKLLEKLKAEYPATRCPLTNQEVAAGTVTDDKLYGVTLLRLCCADCKAAFEKDPGTLAVRAQEARSKGGKKKEEKPREG